MSTLMSFETTTPPPPAGTFPSGHATWPRVCTPAGALTGGPLTWT
jgi:hypothetical protein